MKILGAVGIGGFYAQGALSAASHLQHQTDENQPSGSRERFVALCIQDAEAIVELSICQQLELSECFHVIEHFLFVFSDRPSKASDMTPAMARRVDKAKPFD